MGKCECRPGYTLYEDETTNTTICQPPTVVLARFLNNKAEKAPRQLYVGNNTKLPNELAEGQNTTETSQNKFEDYL